MRFKIVILLGLFFAVYQSSAVVTVGTSTFLGVCDYTTIQSALSSGDSEIRIVRNSFTENIVINYAVEMIGGYDSCNHAISNTPEVTQKTVIFGTAVLGESAIKIILNNSFVVLRNFNIQGARKDISVSDGGHGIKIEGTTGRVDIINSLIQDNISDKGGGIYLKEGTEDKYVRIVDSKVQLNRAVGYATGDGIGGGIYCGGTGSHVFIEGESEISFNTADKGGGIAAVYGCFVRVSSGIDINNSATRRGVMNNHAFDDGGGIYSTNEAFIRFDPTFSGGDFATIEAKDYPATLAKNTAGRNGGGGYAAFGGEISLKDTLVQENSAIADGGGFYLITKGRITTNRTGLDCWNMFGCTIIRDNTADKGGAAYFSTNSSSSFSYAIFSGNRANTGTIMSLFGVVNDNETTVYLHTVIMHSNGNNGVGDYSDFNAIVLGNNSELNVVQATITDNDIADNSHIISNIASSLIIRESIIHNNDNVLTEYQAKLSLFTCLLVNEDNTISGSTVYVQDPGFVNRANNDYHLRPDSFAVDLCYNLGGGGQDFDYDSRGIDIVSLVDIGGTVDAGADEYNDHEAVFKSGFE